MLKKNNLVIALGGGSFVNESIRKEVKNTSISFWLNLNKDSLLKRLKNVKKRPLLNKENLEESINKICSDRKKFYNQANYKIKCDLLNIDQIVTKIIKLYENTRT
jgi:shikimate kinase